MFKYLIFVAVLFPLMGVFLMERGAYGISIGDSGYQNGASLVYLSYVVVLLSVFFLFKKSYRLVSPSLLVDGSMFYRYAYRVCVLHFLMIFCMVFFFGAYSVWAGQVGKGEFRANLGGFGVFAYLMAKYISPCALGYMAFLYVNSARGIGERLVLGVGLLLGVLLGSTWGFKSTGISIILPSLLIIYWNAGLFTFLKIGLFAFSLLLLMGFVFDDSGSVLAAVEFLWIRLTVIQGDVSWLVWGLFNDGHEFPSYMKTLPALMGDRLLSLFFGISRDDYPEWVSYHYDLLINQVVGLPLDVVEGGHNVVGTPFSEGLIMFGLPGVFFMAVLGGGISAFVYNRIQRALLVGSGISAALWASYFSFFVFSWLIGGAIVQMFHVSVFVGYMLSYFVVLFMRRLVILKMT